MPNNYILTSNGELYHYGVLGMKWGVRRFQPYPSDYRGNGKEIGQVKRKRSRIGYDDDIIVKKSTKAYRISDKTSDNDDMLYLTVDKNDRNFYKATWPRTVKIGSGTAGKDATIYEQKYRTKEDLISPSAAKRQKIAADLASSESGKNAIAESHMTNIVARRFGVPVKKAKEYCAHWSAVKDKGFMDEFSRHRDAISKLIDDEDELGKAKYLLGAMGTSDNAKRMFGEAVVKAGYNMVIDDHGADFAGNNKRVNAPIIVLKASQSLEQIGSKPVSDFQSFKARKRYLKDMSTIPGWMSERNYVPNVVKEAYGTNNYYKNRTSQYIYDRDNRLVK